MVAGPIDQLSVKQVSAIGENTLKKVPEWITWPQRARPQNLVWWWTSTVIVIAGLGWLAWWAMRPGTPSCDGKDMSPGDVCIFSNSSSKTYDEMLGPKVWLAVLAGAAALALLIWVSVVSARARKPTPAEAADFYRNAVQYRASVVASVAANPGDPVLAYHLERLDLLVGKAMERNGIVVRGQHVAVE